MSACELFKIILIYLSELNVCIKFVLHWLDVEVALAEDLWCPSRTSTDRLNIRVYTFI